jgi:hypothetical protein
MCHYTGVLGEGTALMIQLITLVAILCTIAFWILIYRKQKVELMQYALPIILWVVFGTLDILITAKGTVGNPMREGNPLARGVFLIVGDFGPVVASVLWISLFAGTVLAINKLVKNSGIAGFVSLAVFYSLATGHLFGFSSWFSPLCAVSKASWAALPDYPVRLVGIIAIGAIASIIHISVMRLFQSGKRLK